MHPILPDIAHNPQCALPSRATAPPPRCPWPAPAPLPWPLPAPYPTLAASSPCRRLYALTYPAHHLTKYLYPIISLHPQSPSLQNRNWLPTPCPSSGLVPPAPRSRLLLPSLLRKCCPCPAPCLRQLPGPGPSQAAGMAQFSHGRDIG